MEPKDVSVEEMVLQITQGAGAGLGRNHPRVTNVLFGDGTVHSIAESIDPELLRGLTTISGGEDVSEFHMGY
jgi:hypothetical protein